MAEGRRKTVNREILLTSLRPDLFLKGERKVFLRNTRSQPEGYVQQRQLVFSAHACVLSIFVSHQDAKTTKNEEVKQETGDSKLQTAEEKS
jgi:hypothetical protein